MPFSSSTRTAIFTNVRLIVSKVAPRQRERFGAARLKLCKQPVGAHVQEEPKLVGLPPRTGGLVGPRPALHVFDQVLGGAWEKAYLQSKKGQ